YKEIKRKIEDIIEKLLHDSKIRYELIIRYIKKGSIRIGLEGDPEDCNKLQRLFRSGELSEILEIPVEDINLVATYNSYDQENMEETTAVLESEDLESAENDTKKSDYILYVHYSYKAKDDFDNCLQNNDHYRILSRLAWVNFRNPNYDPRFAGLDLQLDGFKRIEHFMMRLKNLLNGENNQYNGVLVLFYDAGLRQLLEEIRPVLFFKDDAQKEEIVGNIKEELFERLRRLPDNKEEPRELKFGSVVGRMLTKLAKENGLTDNLRILTSLDLVDVFSEMSDVHELRDLFLGESGNIGYDSPKIIDAIIRLRLLGSGIPVFRLDQDILFPNEDEEKAYEMLNKAIAGQIKAIERHQVKSTIHSTILSVNYEEPEKAIKSSKKGSNLIAYSRSYATRIHPALLVNTKLLSEPPINWNTYAERSFDKTLAQKFFNNKNLIKWGAPTTAVLSGALMYLSDGVVLNLPPFSNFSLNVMWIDDHLRYAVHRELGDFSAITRYRNDGLPLNSKDDSTSVIKCRSGFDNLAFYTLSTYLPGLLWGSIFDAWISTEPLVKLRKTEARRLHREQEWRNKKTQDNMGIFAKRIKHAQAGHPIVDEVQLREDLRQVALTRIQEVREVWRELYIWQTHQEKRSDRFDTFASCWATHNLPDELINLINEQEDETKQELARGIPEQIIVGSVWGNQLERLITDAVNYLRWVQKWPHVVQVVRSLKRGVLPSDL
ncbi:MAG: hypothetical protein AAGA80_10980, partial [Cyanobacteria bacterium P01_F01_bin.143]